MRLVYEVRLHELGENLETTADKTAALRSLGLIARFQLIRSRMKSGEDMALLRREARSGFAMGDSLAKTRQENMSLGYSVGLRIINFVNVIAGGRPLTASHAGVPAETAVHNLGCYQMIIVCRKWAMEALRGPGNAVPITPNPGQPIAPRELHLPRPLPRVTIVRSDEGGARGAEVRNAIARHVLAAFPGTEVLEPDAPYASRATWLNRAIARAHGDVVVVLRGDVAPLDARFLPAVLEELMYADLVGALGTHWLVAPALAWAGAPWLQGWPLRRDGARITLTVHGLEAPVARGVQALDGTLLALRRDVAQRLRFDEGFAGWHLCELEASHRAYRLGLRLSVLSPCALLADPPRPFDDAFRGEAQRFAQLHPVPPPFPHRPVPGVTAPFVDVADALSACAWLEHFCAERWRLAWELPPVPVAA